MLTVLCGKGMLEYVSCCVHVAYLLAGILFLLGHPKTSEVLTAR